MRMLLATLVPVAALAQQPSSPEEIMTANDLNEDGVITRAEAERADTPLAAIFDQVDSDMDGRITMQELEDMEGRR